MKNEHRHSVISSVWFLLAVGSVVGAAIYHQRDIVKYERANNAVLRQNQLLLLENQALMQGEENWKEHGQKKLDELLNRRD